MDKLKFSAMTPIKCSLWQKKNLVPEDLEQDHFEILKEYTNDSHLGRLLIKCKECGQLYFYEFYEVVDFDKGNDSQYVTYIPIISIENADQMAKMTPFELLLFSPRLQRDIPIKADSPEIHWIGK
jgi:hypothetical protein